jgi:hydrogenase nickel incorporation protein HypA/HybF
MKMSVFQVLFIEIARNHLAGVTNPLRYAMMGTQNHSVMIKLSEKDTGDMHELGTIYYVIETVEKLVAENDLKEVASITLEVGEVSGIIPEYLTDFWLYARKKTELFQETELKIEPIHAVTYCQACGKTYPTIPQGKICSHCGSGNTFLITGNEYNIKEIEAC